MDDRAVALPESSRDCCAANCDPGERPAAADREAPEISPCGLAFLARLRAQTSPEHISIEVTLALEADGFSLDTYRLRLMQLYGFYRPIEDRLLQDGRWPDYGLHLLERHKSGLLESDLRALGVNGIDSLPLCRDLPPLDDPAQRFGCLYVLEGASLGGRIIGRRVRDHLGIDIGAKGAKFFHGYGENTGRQWQSFRAQLARFGVDEDKRQRVIASAAATFRALRVWCEGGR